MNWGAYFRTGGARLKRWQPAEREAELLQVEERDPMVLLDSVTYLKDGTPVEYYHAIHRGDRSRFEVDLHRALPGDDDLPSVSLVDTPSARP